MPNRGTVFNSDWLTPVVRREDDPDEVSLPPVESLSAVVLAAIAALPKPEVTVVEVEAPEAAPVDVSPIVAAISKALTAQTEMIVSALRALPREDSGPALREITKELASLRKKMSGVAASGSGGGYGEVALRTANKEPVGPDNPLPVTVSGLPDLSGTWGYEAGTNGAVALPVTAKVKQITATALGAQGSFTINGGDVILLPYDSTDKASSSIDMPIVGELVAPAIVFDANVDAYLVQYLA